MKVNTCLAGCIICLATIISATADETSTVKASDFGFNSTNATACLQAAIDSCAKRVIVDKQETNWIVGPVAMRSGQEVVLENGVVVEAVSDGSKGRYDALFVFRNVRHSILRGEGRAVLKMRKADGPTTTSCAKEEWRHAIGILDACNVSISNLSIVANGGNIVFAPSDARSSISNVVVENCTICDNNGCGLDFHLDMLRSDSKPFSAVVRGCRVCGNASYGLKLDMGTTDPVGGTLSFEDCTFVGNGKAALFFRNQYDGRMQISFDKCVFDARGCEGAAVEIRNSTRFNPFGGVRFRYVDLVADAEQEKILFSALPGAGAENVIGNFDLLYGDAPRDIVPAIAEMGLPKHDPELDVPPPRDDAACEAALERAMDAAWEGVFKHNFNPKTKIVYDGPQENLPTPEEIAANIPNICGWRSGMEDGPLNGGPLLLAALARLDAHGGKDPEAERAARDTFAGLVLCAEVSGVPGFLARGVCPVDGKSFYPSSSRDQYTLFVYAMWRAWHHPFAEKEGWKPKIARMLADIADYCARGVTAASGWKIPRSDGGEPLVSTMWTDDPKTGRPDGRGSRDFGDLFPHEATRLPMIYAAAWDATGDMKWRDMYETYAGDAIAMSEWRDPASERVFAILQMHVANLLMLEVDPDPGHKARLLKILEQRTRWALAVSCPRARVETLYENCRPAIGKPMADWRTLKRRPIKPVGSGENEIRGFVPVYGEADLSLRWYVYEAGQRVLVQALCPGWRISRADAVAFASDMARIDFSKPCWNPPVHALWYYWHMRARAGQR